MLQESRDGPLLPLVLFLLIQRETFLAKLLALNLRNLVIVIVFVALSLSLSLALNLCILVKCCISWSQSEETSGQVEKMQVSGEQEMWSILSWRPLQTTWQGLHDGHVIVATGMMLTMMVMLMLFIKPLAHHLAWFT